METLRCTTNGFVAFGTLTFITVPLMTKANEEIQLYNERTNVQQCVDSGPSAINVNCGKTYRVSWIEWAPYFSQNGTRFSGIYKKILDMLQSTCKRGCRYMPLINLGQSSSIIVPAVTGNASGITLQFDKQPLGSYADLLAEIKKETNNMSTTKNPRLFLPVAVTEEYDKTVDGFPFLFYVDAKVLHFVERKVKGDLLSLIWQGVVNSWELLGIVLLLAALFGMVVWLAERNNNSDDFPYEFSAGATVGFWFTCVTMTTVGYGDKSPKSFIGRTATLAWMLISLCLFPLLMANFTNLINDGTVNSLFAVKVGVMKDRPEATCARKDNADVKEFDTFEKALDALANKEVNGVLIEKNSAINVKNLVESKGLRISRSFECSLRIGIVAEPQWDPKNNKTVVKSIQKMRQMHELCLKEKCRNKLYGEAVNAAQKKNEEVKAAKTTQTSDTKLLVPLAVLGGLVGCFILIGFSYDLFKRNSSNVTDESKYKADQQSYTGNIFGNKMEAGSYVNNTMK